MQHFDTRLREAALLLHGLSADRREAVLARLEPGHREALRPLLAELAALGIPGSIARAAAPGAPARLRAADVAPAVPDPQRSAHALRACAAPTVAALLKEADGPWRAAVLGALERHRRREVAESLERGLALPPRVTDALRVRLRAEAGGSAALTAVPLDGATRPWKRWLRWTS